ncbi:MAG: 50S ribosomal protein L13 [Acidilobaceae archaeon]|nr:50S ribosomal protein L13 [Acidilobaceae archaeon]MCX8165808.1 50S ribosomal protein L13 [Acidilobaceae archaeon]MDW7974233.1 50S ribosomal protein L13 [Sulfolobales archaeon]
MEEVYVNGENMILGRLASKVAKLLLSGKRVYVVNAEKVVVSGDRSALIYYYKRTILGVRSHLSHKWRPKRPRSPIRLFKAAVWGMLPKNNKGIRALKALRVYVGVPEELKGKELVAFEEASSQRLARKPVPLAVIAKELGWRGGEA